MFSLPLSRPLSWNYYQDFERVIDDVNRTLSVLREDREPHDVIPINVWSTPDGIVVNAEVPGVNPADISVSVLDTTLTIHGTRAKPQADITRVVDLPYRVVTEQTEARCHDGVLTVALKRPETEKPRRIAVNAA